MMNLSVMTEDQIQRREKFLSLIAAIELLIGCAESSYEMQCLYGALMDIRAAMFEEGLGPQCGAPS